MIVPETNIKKIDGVIELTEFNTSDLKTPTPKSDKVYLYAADVSGSTKLMTKNASGTVEEVGAGGGGGSTSYTWTAYTPSITGTVNPGFGSAGAINGSYTKVSKVLHLNIRYSQNGAGTTGTGTYKFSLPSGTTFDLTHAPVGTVIGSFLADFTVGVVIVDSNSTFSVVAGGAAVGPDWLGLGDGAIKYDLSLTAPVS